MSRSFFDLFPPPKSLLPSIAGLSVSDDAIRSVEYNHRHGKLSIRSQSEYLLPEGVISDGAIVNQDKLLEFLKKVSKEQKITSCAFSLPEEKSFVFMATISLPETFQKTSFKEILRNKNLIRELVKGTLKENIVISAEEVVFDFVITSYDEKSRIVNVVVCAFPLDLATLYADVLLRAGITPIYFENESQAVAQAVIPHEHSGAHIIAHFTPSKAMIAVVLDGVVSFASTVTHSSGAISGAASSATSGANNKDIKSVSEPIELMAVKDQLSRVVSYWHSNQQVKTREKSKIKSIIVSGAVGEMLDLPDYLSKNINLPSHLANVWQNAFSVDEIIPEISFNRSLVFAPAAGLALLPFLKDE